MIAAIASGAMGLLGIAVLFLEGRGGGLAVATAESASAAISLAPWLPVDRPQAPSPRVSRRRAHRESPVPVLDIPDLRPWSGGPPTETPESVRRQAEELRAHPTADASLPCATAAAHRQGAHPARLSARIGLDGRVIEAEIERSSGDPDLDRALVQCAAAWGPFPLAIIDGRVVDSSQLIDWPPASLRDPAPIEQPTS